MRLGNFGFKGLGLLDLVSVIVVVVVLLLPGGARKFEPLYPRRPALDVEALATAQADLALSPHDGTVLLRFVDLLAMGEQSDLALRIAGDLSSGDNAKDPRRWRALLAIASVHADRLEPKDTYAWAQKALLACDAEAAACPAHERVRIDLYMQALKSALDTGIDPKADPEGFRAALERGIPMIHIGGRHNVPPQ